MEKTPFAPFLVGTVVMQSNLEIEEVGDILSQALFGGLKLGGKDKRIYEEVPAIFLHPPILGFRAILQGYKGFGKDEGYVLTISPEFTVRDVKRVTVRLDLYLIHLVKDALKNSDQIKGLDFDPKWHGEI